MVKKYRKKPVVIEALQFIDEVDRLVELSEFIDNQDLRVDYKDPENPVLKLDTLEGVMTASIGDYIIKGVNGEFYPCKPDIFLKTYDEVQKGGNLMPCGGKKSSCGKKSGDKKKGGKKCKQEVS